MENSFKKQGQYEKVQQDDGSFVLKFKRTHPLFNPVINGFLSLMLTAVLGGAGIFVSGFASFCIGLVVIYLVLSNTIGKKAHEIRVTPGVGLAFLNKTLPFSDISDLELKGMGGFGAILYAVSFGRKISVSGAVSNDLAKALGREIQAAMQDYATADLMP